MQIICMGYNEIEYLDEGWYGIDRAPEGLLFRATKEQAQLHIANASGAFHLELLLSARPEHSGQPLIGQINAANHSSIDFTLTHNHWVTRGGRILLNNQTPLTISVENPWSPDQLYHNGDARSLGVMISAIRLYQLNPLVTESIWKNLDA